MTPHLPTRLRAALHRLRRRLRNRPYHLKEQIPVPASCRASIVVPTKNRADLLRTAVEGVLHRTDYPNLEIIVVDNGSDQPDALQLSEELRRTSRATVLTHAGAFNFSALSNLGARAATGDVLCFLNNDVRITQPGWLRELAGLALQPDVGAAGPLLYYPDGRVQHLGIRVDDGFPRLIGDGSDANAFRNSPASRQRREVDALTGACLVVSRTRFENIGGFDEQLAVAYNDVDLCLHLRSRGLRIVWTPFAEMIHELSASRGFARSDADRARHRREWQRLRRKWYSDDEIVSPNGS